MTARAIHWHEGMFLRPHHMQAAQRHLEHLSRTGDKWDLNYNWGLRHILIDREALANHRLVIHTLQARLRDGTLVSIPEDGTLAARELKEVLDRETQVMAYLALPLVRLGRANVGGNSQETAGRYFLDTQEVEDENTGLNPQLLQVRLVNMRVVFSSEEQTGFELLPLARIEKSSEATTAPQVQASYIPPLLACDAWRVLQIDIIQAIYDRIGKKIEALANQVLSRGIALESQAPADILTVNHLRILNEAYALLGILAFVEGRHPLEVYLELCRLVGQLSIYSDERRPPGLPRYDHDDLGGCFYQVKIYLDKLLSLIIEPEYKQRPFLGAALSMKVDLDRTWLEPSQQMFVGVWSSLPSKDCVSLMTTAGKLDTKLGSFDRVEKIFKDGLPGLKFTHTPHPPRALPQSDGLVYFQVSRDSQLDEWKFVEKTSTLALRLNEKTIVGNIQGERTLTIRTPPSNTTATFRFTLFVVANL